MREFFLGAIEKDDGKTREEKIKINSVPVTEKSYDELSEQEREEVIHKLLTEKAYYIKDGVHIAYGREMNLQKDVFYEEFLDCKELVQLGYEVYLLPNGCTSKAGNFKEFADTITDCRLLELKHITSAKKAGDRYQEGRHQGQDVYIAIHSPINEETALKQIFNKIRRIKEHNATENFEGRLFLHFKTERKTLFYTINKYGVVKKTTPFGSPATEFLPPKDELSIPQNEEKSMNIK